MEAILSAIVGELTNKSISFLIDRCSKLKGPTLQESMQSIQRMLLRVRIVVEEADGRHITNQGMLEQLKMLRDEMYKGCYMLDTFKYLAHQDDNAKDDEVSHPFTLGKFNPVKRLCISSGNKHSIKEVQEMVGNLNNIIGDMNELVQFLNTYPPIYRQPYSMYLYLEKCMFGRQVEMERAISFLLCPNSPDADNLGVLPIVGSRGVGKSTLVEHVCNNERVRNHFSRIIFSSETDVKDEMLAALRDGDVTKHQDSALDRNGRSLVIIELVEDIGEDAWRKLYSAYESCLGSGSKIILTSRSESIANFGTTQALVLNFLPHEAYWYFFKVLVFGSTDPDEQPKRASMAMEICKELDGTFFAVNIIADLLRTNCSAQFWCGVLIHLRALLRQRNTFQFGAPSLNLWTRNKPMPTQRMGKTTEYWALYDSRQTSFARNEVPKITIQEVIYGNAIPHGEFEALEWKSRIPPYNSYVVRCGMRRPRHMVARKKLSQKRMI